MVLMNNINLKKKKNIQFELKFELLKLNSRPVRIDQQMNLLVMAVLDYMPLHFLVSY